MKNFIKFGCLGFITLVVIIIILAITTSGEDETSEEEQSAAKVGILTEEKFNQISNGMSYDEVKSIIGSEGTVISETGEIGSESHNLCISGKQMDYSPQLILLSRGKLINTSEMGVAESSDVTVTLDEFNQVQNGMTYDEVVAIVGGEGNLISESGDKGTEFYTVMYDYTGEGDLGANASFISKVTNYKTSRNLVLNRKN